MEPELQDWHPPRKDGKAALDSLQFQLRKVIPGSPLPIERVGSVLNIVSESKSVDHVMSDAHLLTTNVDDLMERIDVAVNNLDMRSTPGYPLCYVGGTNEAVFEVMGDKVIKQMVCDRIILINSLPIWEFSRLRDVDFVRLGLRDPVRLFIKNELHSTVKVANNQWRLIWAVSLVDQLVDRVLCGPMNGEDIANYAELPVCPGMSRNEDGRKVLQTKISKMECPVGDDVSAWDLSVTWQMLNFDACRRAARKSALCGGAFKHIYNKVALMVASKVAVMPSGHILVQDKLGVIPSGWYNTSSSNSWCRVMVSCVINPREICYEQVLFGSMAQGDDCVEDVPKGFDLVGAYGKYGFRLKEPEWLEDGKLEFCALTFHQNGEVFPSRPVKMLASFFYNYPTPETYAERVFQLIEVELEGAQPHVLSWVRNLIRVVEERLTMDMAVQNACRVGGDPVNLSYN